MKMNQIQLCDENCSAISDGVITVIIIYSKGGENNDNTRLYTHIWILWALVPSF